MYARRTTCERCAFNRQNEPSSTNNCFIMNH
uniref:Uncharacterized protein n=1 Tax=Anguilla anguilla TaxID=7936 RepID=A0A0E9TTI5_ANGAN